jgi:hypothetical protein
MRSVKKPVKSSLITIDYDDHDEEALRRYRSIEKMLVYSIEQLRGQIREAVEFIRKTENNNIDTEVVFWLWNEALLDATDRCSFKLVIGIDGKGPNAKISLELEDPNGWGCESYVLCPRCGSDDVTGPDGRPTSESMKPFTLPIGYVQLPPFDCHTYDDEVVHCDFCGAVVHYDSEGEEWRCPLHGTNYHKK